MHPQRKIPVTLASLVALLALVAGSATVPAGAADAEAMQGRRVATKFKKINWPATPATPAVHAFVNGKIKSKKRNKRVALLQQKLPSGWQQVDKDKTNKRGRFHLKLRTNWYHKKLKMRVVIKKTRKAGGNTSKKHGFTVNPAYPLMGSPHAWNRIAPGYKIQFNPCNTIRWKGNFDYAPAGAWDDTVVGMAQLAAATGIRFKYAGSTNAIPGSKRRWPKNTNLVVAWAAPSQTKWNLHGNYIGRGGQLKTKSARTGKGKRAYQITRSGLVLDNTFPAPAGFLGPNARGSIIIHELGHVAGLGHAFQSVQTMYPSAINSANGLYQAGDLAGLRKVGLSSGCLHRFRGHGRIVPGYVPPPEPVLAIN